MISFRDGSTVHIMQASSSSLEKMMDIIEALKKGLYMFMYTVIAIPKNAQVAYTFSTEVLKTYKEIFPTRLHVSSTPGFGMANGDVMLEDIIVP